MLVSFFLHLVVTGSSEISFQLQLIPSVHYGFKNDQPNLT